MQKNKFSSSPLDENLRLDLYLLLRYSEFSRNFIATAIKKGFVTINAEPVLKPSCKVKPSDNIAFDFEQARKAISHDDFENVIPHEMTLDIIFEDEDILVLNKPSGLPTHPSLG